MTRAGWKSLLPGLALLLLAGLVYFNAISHPFVYDDLGLVLKNRRYAAPVDSLPSARYLTHGQFEPTAPANRDELDRLPGIHEFRRRYL